MGVSPSFAATQAEMHRVAEINIALWVRALMPALDGIVSRICSSARHQRHETEMKTLGRELEAMGTSGALHHEEMATYVWGTRRRNGPATQTPPMSPLAEAWAWQLSAGCRGADSSTFFHPDGERGLKRQRREREAKRVCAQCPVVRQCLDHALEFQEPYGVWGGLTEDERHTLLGHAKRGRRWVDHDDTNSDASNT